MEKAILLYKLTTDAEMKTSIAWHGFHRTVPSHEKRCRRCHAATKLPLPPRCRQAAAAAATAVTLLCFRHRRRHALPYSPSFHQCIVPSTDLIYSCGVVLVLWRRSLQTYLFLHTKLESGAGGGGGGGEAATAPQRQLGGSLVAVAVARLQWRWHSATA